MELKYVCSLEVKHNYESNTNQRTKGPVKANLISWPSKAQNVQNLKNIW